MLSEIHVFFTFLPCSLQNNAPLKMRIPIAGHFRLIYNYQREFTYRWFLHTVHTKTYNILYCTMSIAAKGNLFYTTLFPLAKR